MAYEYSEERLTGRAACRTGWLGRQVLQVEVAADVYGSCPPPPERYSGTAEEWKATQYKRTTTHWRDAKPDDVRCVVINIFAIGAD